MFSIKRHVLYGPDLGLGIFIPQKWLLQTGLTDMCVFDIAVYDYCVKDHECWYGTCVIPESGGFDYVCNCDQGYSGPYCASRKSYPDLTDNTCPISWLTRKSDLNQAYSKTTSMLVLAPNQSLNLSCHV